MYSGEAHMSPLNVGRKFGSSANLAALARVRVGSTKWPSRLAFLLRWRTDVACPPGRPTSIPWVEELASSWVEELASGAFFSDLQVRESRSAAMRRRLSMRSPSALVVAMGPGWIGEACSGRQASQPQ